MEAFANNLTPLWEYVKAMGVDGILLFAVVLILYRIHTLKRRIDRLVDQAETRDDLFRAGEEATHKQLSQLLEESSRIRDSGPSSRS